MKLPEKLKIPLTIVGEASTEGVVNQLIDYLKEREEPHIYNTFSTEKPCTCGGRGARGEHGSPKCSQYGNNDYVPPKKIDEELGAGGSGNMMPIDVEGLLEEYGEIWRKMITYPERIGNKSRLQQIINQIKDAIHENN